MHNASHRTGDAGQKIGRRKKIRFIFNKYHISPLRRKNASKNKLNKLPFKYLIRINAVLLGRSSKISKTATDQQLSFSSTPHFRFVVLFI